MSPKTLYKPIKNLSKSLKNTHLSENLNII